MLNSFLNLKYRDTEVLDDTAELIANGTITNINSITGILYVIAKFKYDPIGKDAMMEKCATIFKKELVLNVVTVCRNLWSF